METQDKRALRIVRTFNAPIDLMWEVWSNPEHIVNWWGPTGFTNEIEKMEFREGGAWEHTMIGPDGTRYPNSSIFREIVPFKKIVFEHLEPHFICTVLFESQGDKTTIDWVNLFDTKEILETVVKVYKADEGQKENVERLDLYLTRLVQSKTR